MKDQDSNQNVKKELTKKQNSDKKEIFYGLFSEGNFDALYESLSQHKTTSMVTTVKNGNNQKGNKTNNGSSLHGETDNQTLFDVNDIEEPSEKDLFYETTSTALKNADYKSNTNLSKQLNYPNKNSFCENFSDNGNLKNENHQGSIFKSNKATIDEKLDFYKNMQKDFETSHYLEPTTTEPFQFLNKRNNFEKKEVSKYEATRDDMKLALTRRNDHMYNAMLVFDYYNI